MSQGKPRDTRKEQQWRRWIGQWQHSGLTIRAFCERHHLSQPSFYAWRRKRFSNAMPSTSTLYVSVQLVPDDEPVAASIVEVVLPGGPTPSCACRRRFDAASLRQLLLVLQEGCSC